jgi:hypothetical protein
MAQYTFMELAFQRQRDQAKQTALELYTREWSKDYGSGDDFIRDRVGPRAVAALQSFFPPRRDNPGPTVIDFGAGKGTLLAFLLASGAVSAPSVGVDLIEVPGRHNEGIVWHQAALWEAQPHKAQFALSTDALEHIDPALVPEALRTIRAAAPHGFLRISTRPGRTRELHLTVKGPPWWLEQLEKAGINPTEYRVECGQALEVTY